MIGKGKSISHGTAALEVAAAGGHNLIMIGAPGSGKSMMAKRLPSILPPLSLGESLETTKIHSVAGKLNRNSSLITQRPFRDPHHTISQVSLSEGGCSPIDVDRPVLLNERCSLLQVREMVQF